MADVPLLWGPRHSLSKPVPHLRTRQEPPAWAWSLRQGTEAPRMGGHRSLCRCNYAGSLGFCVGPAQGFPWWTLTGRPVLHSPPLDRSFLSVSWTVENPQESLFQGLLGKPQQAGAWRTGVSGQDAVFFSGASGGEPVVVWKTLQSPRRVTSVVAKEVNGKCGNKQRPPRKEPSNGY